MTLFLTYELKVAILVAVFYIFWRLLVAKETWHRLNRIVLLSTAIASFILPLCVITIHQTVELLPTVTDDFVSTEDMGTPPVQAQPFNWHLPLTIIYLIGVAVVLTKMVLSIWQLNRMTAESEILPLEDGRQLALSEKAKTPFSWWNTVFLNHNDYTEGLCADGHSSETDTSALLTHELAHLQLHHSFDVVLVELLTALQWFNPAMWMLRADLRTIHEYEADQQVLSHGFNDIQYLHLLIRKAAGQGGYSLANGISNSALKKRVTMIMKPRSNHNSMLKLLVLIPIVGIALALNARTVTSYIYDEPLQQQPIKKGKKDTAIKVGSQTIKVKEQPQAEESLIADDSKEPVKVSGIVFDNGDGQPVPGTIIKIAGSKTGTVTDMDGKFTINAKVGDKIEVMYVGMETVTFEVKKENPMIHINLKKDSEDQADKVYDVVDQMPQFPGGSSALMQYLSMNMRYPKEATQAKSQGRVIVSFTVGKDGSISDTHVAKSVAPSLDEEALRVIHSMPKWEPGIQDGKPVAVRYVIPVTFKLQGKNTPEVTGGDKQDHDTQGHEGTKHVHHTPVSIWIDGVKTSKSMEQVSKELSVGDIVSMTVDKSDPNDHVIMITTKNKK